MLGRTHRFHGLKALNGVYKRGKTVRAPMLSLRYAQRSADKPHRVAVVVSKKVNKSAVARNRIRRRVYAVVQAVTSGGPDGIKPGTDMIFTVFDDRVREMPPDELRKTVDGLVDKAAARQAPQSR
jgi:ribonuclease P protein component